MKIMNFFAMAIAGLAFIACNNEDEVVNSQVENNDLANIAIDMGSLTRAALEDAYTGSAKFRTLQFVVLDVDGKIVKSAYLNETALDAYTTETDAPYSTATYIIENVDAKAAQVYVVGNAAEISIATDKTKTLADFKAVTTAKYTHTSQNSDFNVVLMDKLADINKTSTATPDANYTWTDDANKTLNTYGVSVVLEPLVSRFQIKAVTKSGKVAGFKIGGVYLNNAYKNMQLNLLGSDALNVTTSAVETSGSNFGAYALIQDDIVIPANKCVGINFFAGATTKLTPHILIKLTGITYSDGYNGLGEGWLTIQSFNNSGNLYSDFKNGDVYTIDNIIFDQGKITPKPYGENINVMPTITVKAWNQVNLVPNF